MGATSGGRRVRRSVAVIGAAVLAIVCVACTTDLGSLGGTYGGAADINDGGTVVGYSSVSGGGIHAFVKTPKGVITDLGTGSRTQSTAHAINELGIVVGSTADKASGPPVQTPFTWTQATGLVQLELPEGAVSAWAVDVNDSGTIVVNSGRRTGEYKAWIYNPTTSSYTALASLGGGYDQAAAIAPDGTVVGSALTPGGVYHAVKWHPTTHAITDLDAGSATASQATGINAAGTIVGWNGDLNAAAAYTWSAGTRTTIGAGYAKAINDAGVVVGTVRKASGDVGHLWDVPHGLDFDFAGVASGGSLDATAINGGGVAVGAAGTAANSVPAQFDAYNVP